VLHLSYPISWVYTCCCLYLVVRLHYSPAARLCRVFASATDLWRQFRVWIWHSCSCHIPIGLLTVKV